MEHFTISMGDDGRYVVSGSDGIDWLDRGEHGFSVVIGGAMLTVCMGIDALDVTGGVDEGEVLLPMVVNPQAYRGA